MIMNKILKTVVFQGVKLQLPTIKNKIQFIRHRKKLKWNCANIYFPSNILNEIECYVNIGANNGYESIIPALEHKQVINIEANKELVECMNITFQKFKNVININAAYSEKVGERYNLSKVKQNESISVVSGNAIRGISLKEIIDLVKIQQGILLQINIEGAEVELLKLNKLPEQIKIVNLSCHDFLADRGQGEELRTYNRIKDYMVSQGFIEEIKKKWGVDYLDSWHIFRRSNASNKGN